MAVGVFAPTKMAAPVKGVAQPFGGQAAINTTGAPKSIFAPVSMAPTPGNPTPPTVQTTAPATPATAGPSGGDRPTGVGPTGYGAATGAPAASTAPNLTAVLESDPAYAQAQTDATQSAGDAAATRTAAIQQAILQFGGVPEGFQDAYGDATPADIAAGQANPYSQLAQAQRQEGQTEESDRQGEAANGSIFSGQTPTDMGNENYNYGATLSGLGQQFGQAAQNAIGAYTGQLSTNQTNLTNALFDAEKNEQTNPAYTSLFDPSTAPAPAASGPAAPARPAIPQTVSGSFSPSKSEKNTLLTPQALANVFRAKAA